MTPEMSAERWQQCQVLFAEFCELTDDMREQALHKLAQTDLQMCEALRAMLVAERFKQKDDASFLEGAKNNFLELMRKTET
jgi:hypothetical protein